MDLQKKCAYQKQPTNFQNKKRVLLAESGKEKLPWYYQNVGLGFKTLKEAIKGTYIDKKCPLTGNVSIQGKILFGMVTKIKTQGAVVIWRLPLLHPKVQLLPEMPLEHVSVPFPLLQGHLDQGHCQRSGTSSQWASAGPLPLQGTVSFNVLKVTKAAGTKKQFQKFWDWIPTHCPKQIKLFSQIGR